MKLTVFSLLAIVLSLQTQIASAADNECQQAFGFNIAQCSQYLDNELLTPKGRGDAHRACVEDARIAKDACTLGVGPCLDLCQAVYNETAVQCEQTYIAELLLCGGDFACNAVAENNRTACLSTALDTLNTCTFSCQQ
jgi:hypothetical protein